MLLFLLLACLPEKGPGADSSPICHGYYDQDGDGYGAGAPQTTECADLAERDGDCNDADPNVNPGAVESCNQRDDDCDGEVDDDPVDGDLTVWVDADLDGYGNPNFESTACGELPEARATNPDDCDDDRADINPDAEEICDGVDNDCDGGVDTNVAELPTWRVDGDGDGYGDLSDAGVEQCDTPGSGYSSTGGDCVDQDPNVFPGQTAFFETARNDSDPWSKSWDYNCDGADEQEYPDQVECDADCNPTGVGFIYFVPGCGAQHAMLDQCVANTFYCELKGTSDWFTQACR